VLIHMLKAKIHRATVTEANLHYEGSITIDQVLLREAGILPYEKVQVVNVNTGARLETYVVEGPPHSGTVCMNGGAARLAHPGDLVIIMAYALLTPDEARAFKPRLVLVDGSNAIREIR